MERVDQQESEDVEYPLGRWNDGGWRGIRWFFATIVFGLIAGYLIFLAVMGPGDTISSILAEVLLVIAPLSVLMLFVGLLTKHASRLEFDEEGWQWLAGKKKLASQSWSEAGGIRVRMGLTNWIEVLKLDGTVLTRIPVSKRRYFLDPILTEIDRQLPADRVRAIHAPDKAKSITARLGEAVTLLAMIVLGLGGAVVAGGTVYEVMRDQDLPRLLLLFSLICAVTAVGILAHVISSLMTAKKLKAREGEPALFRFPLAGTSWLSIMNQASNYVFSRKRRRAQLTLIEIQEGYIDLLCLGKTTRIKHGEFPMRLDETGLAMYGKTGWIVFEADPEIIIPNYIVGQIDLFTLLETLKAGHQPDPELLAADVIEWLYRDQDLDEDLEQSAFS